MIHVLHIGKTGGTAVKAALERFPAGRPIALHRHRTRLMDVPEGEKAVFFLREPVGRFVSGFCSRLRQGRPRYESPWSPAEAAAFARFPTANALAEALFAEDPARRTAGEAAMRGIAHVRSSFSDWFGGFEYFDSRRDDVLFVGFQERLAEDFERLKSLLGLPSAAALPHDPVEAHRNPEGADLRLSDAGRAGLARWYADDVAFYERCRRLF